MEKFISKYQLTARCECYISTFCQLIKRIYLFIHNILCWVGKVIKVCLLVFSLETEEVELIKNKIEEKRRQEMGRCNEKVKVPTTVSLKNKNTNSNSNSDEEQGTCIGVFKPYTQKKGEKIMKEVMKSKLDFEKSIRNLRDECNDKSNFKREASFNQQVKFVRSTCTSGKCKNCKLGRIPVLIYNKEVKLFKQDCNKGMYRAPSRVRLQLRSLVQESATNNKTKKKQLHYYECYRHQMQKKHNKRFHNTNSKNCLKNFYLTKPRYFTQKNKI